jgi:hypothetical protein
VTRPGRSWNRVASRRALSLMVASLTGATVLAGPVAEAASPGAGRVPHGVAFATPAMATPTAAGREYGAYEWDDTSWWPDPSGYADTLVRLQSLGVTTLYVDITEGVTLLKAHSSALTGFESAFRQLVTEAGADGMEVDALGGDPAWATTQKKGPAQLLAVVSQIVAGAPAVALDGVQFDVEPWALKKWGSHRSAYAGDWVRFIASTVAQWRADGLGGRLGFTVPYWFDGATGGVPQVTVDGSTGYPFQLALGALSVLPDTVLNVMAYRNTTTGPNGSLALFGSNVDAVDSAGSATTLLAGQETGNVRPAETTFYGMSCSSFMTATNQINDEFESDTSYEGIAVDDVESLEALCPG